MQQQQSALKSLQKQAQSMQLEYQSKLEQNAATPQQQPLPASDAKAAASGLAIITNMTASESKLDGEKETAQADKPQSANDVMQKFSSVLNQLKQRGSQVPLQEVEQLTGELGDLESGEEQGADE